MGGEGSISAMIASLKNNKLQKRKPEKGRLTFEKGTPIGEPLAFTGKMTDEEMRIFRKALIRRKNRSTLLFIVFSAIVLVSLIGGILVWIN